MCSALRSHLQDAVCASVAAAAILACSGCATPEERVEQRRVDISAAPITHMVLIELKDPTRAQELIEDCNRSVPGIPAVQAYACGLPLPSGRPNVVDDYTVGFCVSFHDEEAYRAYTEDPAHLALVEKWHTAWKSVRIFDVLDAPTPSSGHPSPSPVALPPATAAPAPQPSTTPATGPTAAPAATPPSPGTRPAPLHAPPGEPPVAPPAAGPASAPASSGKSAAPAGGLAR